MAQQRASDVKHQDTRGQAGVLRHQGSFGLGPSAGTASRKPASKQRPAARPDDTKQAEG